MNIALLAALAHTLAAQEPLTLQQAEELALRNHPRLAAARLTADAAHVIPKQLQAAQLPTINGAFSSSVADHLSRIGAGGLNASSLFSRVGAGINISQMVYDFGRNKQLVEASKARAGGETENTRTIRNEILLRVRQTFYSGLLALKMNEATRQVLESRKVLLRQLTVLAENNLKSTLDVSFAEIGVTEAELELERGLNAYRSAQAELSAAMGVEQDKEWNLQLPPPLPPVMDSIDMLLGEAKRNRPEIASARQNIEALRRTAEAEKKLPYPSISLAGAGGFIPAGDPRLQNRYGGIGLTLTVPVFNGYLNSARLSEATLRLQASEQSFRDLELRLARDLKLALIETANAANRIVATAKYRDQAVRTLRLSQSRYDLGLGSIVELTQAQTVRLSAEIQSAAAIYEHQLRLSLLQFQLGR